MRIKQYLLVLAFSLVFVSAFSQTPAQRASLLLKEKLQSIISQHTKVGYDNIWTAFALTDMRSDGTVWEIYSNTANYACQTKGENVSATEGVNYNREHAVPQSWFQSAEPMYDDLFHIYPADGNINSWRSNSPYGEVASASKTSADGFSCYGTATTECGAPCKVFEPNDEYKGDLARTYFYMVTCYGDKVGDWSGEVFGRSVAPDTYVEYAGYPGMAEWALKMFLRWSHDDPVSQKERDRNDAIYKLQGNRNPFIDCPGLERYLWYDYLDKQ